MTQATIRTAIFNSVDGVTDVGQVYDRLRFTNSYDVFQELFKANIGGIDQIRGWMIEYSGVTAERAFTCNDIRRHTFLISGYNRVNDERASEKEFATLTEAVIDALDADTTVHDHTDTAIAQVSAFEVRMFGNVACHYAEITQVVTEET